MAGRPEGGENLTASQNKKGASRAPFSTYAFIAPPASVGDLAPHLALGEIEQAGEEQQEGHHPEAICLRSSRCGSAAHIRKAETSREYWSIVCGEPSS